jgi:hypothetical protein
VHPYRVSALPGQVEAGQRLKQTALRDFGPAPEEDDDDQQATIYKLTQSLEDVPIPILLRYALTLIGAEADGPGEKVAWWVNFTYRGEWCQLAHQKFGLRLYLRTEAPEDEVPMIAAQIMKSSDPRCARSKS